MRFTPPPYLLPFPHRSLTSAIYLHFSLSPISRPFLLPLSSQISFLHRRQTLTFSMASDELSTLPADDEKYGFRRPEMYQSNLTDTVDAYDRHVFLCYKSPETWPSRIEDSETDPLPKRLASAFKARRKDMTVKVGEVTSIIL